MTRAKLRQEWAQVSALAACLMNENRLDEKIPLDFLVPKFETEPETETETETEADTITDPETKRRIMESLKGRF